MAKRFSLLICFTGTANEMLSFWNFNYHKILEKHPVRKKYYKASHLCIENVKLLFVNINENCYMKMFKRQDLSVGGATYLKIR